MKLVKLLSVPNSEWLEPDEDTGYKLEIGEVYEASLKSYSNGKDYYRIYDPIDCHVDPSWVEVLGDVD